MNSFTHEDNIGQVKSYQNKRRFKFNNNLNPKLDSFNQSKSLQN